MALPSKLGRQPCWVACGKFLFVGCCAGILEQSMGARKGTDSGRVVVPARQAAQAT